MKRLYLFTLLLVTINVTSAMDWHWHCFKKKKFCTIVLKNQSDRPFDYQIVSKNQIKRGGTISPNTGQVSIQLEEPGNNKLYFSFEKGFWSLQTIKEIENKYHTVKQSPFAIGTIIYCNKSGIFKTKTK